MPARDLLAYDDETTYHDYNEKVHDKEEKDDVEQEENGAGDWIRRRQVVEIEVAQ